MTTKPHPQLSLAVTPADYATFDNFYTVGNDTVVEVLRQLPAGLSHWLHGDVGSGKSHLLQAVCTLDGHGAYLTGATINEWPAGALEGFERFARVCIDDIHQVLGDREREVDLFHLYNRLQEQGGVLLASATLPPTSFDFALPDLGSRLRASVTLHVDSQDDDGAIAALQLRAKGRGLELPAETGRYLLRRYKRDMGSLCALLDRLDAASLAAQRKLTVPFVRTIL